MDDTYVYLLAALPFFVLSMVFFVIRPDLRGLIIKAGLLGGVAGLLSEYWYFKDYWQPPSLRGLAAVSVEDFVFGFGVTAVAASVYKVMTHAGLVKKDKPALNQLMVFMAGGLGLLVIFNNWLGLNSIFVSSAIFLGIAMVILVQRKDLLKQAVFTAVVLVCFATLVYLPLFNILAPDYLRDYFLLDSHVFNPSIFGAMPVFEIMWYFSWGFLAGILYDFVSGSYASSEYASRKLRFGK